MFCRCPCVQRCKPKKLRTASFYWSLSHISIEQLAGFLLRVCLEGRIGSVSRKNRQKRLQTGLQHEEPERIVSPFLRKDSKWRFPRFAPIRSAFLPMPIYSVLLKITTTAIASLIRSTEPSRSEGWTLCSMRSTLLTPGGTASSAPPPPISSPDSDCYSSVIKILRLLFKC